MSSRFHRSLPQSPPMARVANRTRTERTQKQQEVAKATAQLDRATHATKETRLTPKQMKSKKVAEETFSLRLQVCEDEAAAPSTNSNQYSGGE
jgi:hypothetical protein